jgi:acetyl-CoA acetyltransferase
MASQSMVGIRGIGETVHQKRSGRTLAQMQVGVIRDAVADAGLELDDIDMVVTDSAVMPLRFGIDKVVSHLRLKNVRRVGMFPVGMVGLIAGLEFAQLMIEQGRARHAVFYFGVDWGSRTGGAYGFHERFPMKMRYELPYGFFGQPVYYATFAQRYAHQHGLSTDELTDGLGHVAMNTRYNASLNKNAQEREVFDLDQYRASPKIAEPLRRYDCSLLTDGAGAFVVSRVDDGWPHEPVVVRAVSHDQQMIDDEDFYTQNPSLPYFPTATRCMDDVLARSGMSRDDIDLLEIYDCFTISLVLQLESLGFYPPGEGIHAAKDGGTRVDGGRPTNTHGGLLSQGYLLGMNHIIEAARQLRHEAGEAQVPGAEVALIAGSPTREYSVALLTRGR